MAEYAVEGKELKKLVGAARKKPLPFAYNPGKGDGDDYFALHRKRSADIMAKVAKKEGSGTKAAYGTCRVDGSVMWLTCEEAVPSMAKKLKKFLKSHKVSLTIKVTDSAGNLLEEEIETDPDIEPIDIEDTADDDDEDVAEEETRAETAPAEEEAGPDRAEIVARIKDAQHAISAAPPPVSAKLTDALKATVGQIKSGDLQGAEAGISRIEAVLSKLPAASATPAAHQPSPDPSPETAANRGVELVNRAKALQPRIAETPPAAAKQLQSALVAVIGQIKARNLDSAEIGLGKIEAALDKLAAQSKAAPSEARPAAAGDPRTTKLRDAAGALRSKVNALDPGDTADALLAQLDTLDAKIGAGEIEEVVTGLKNIQASLKLQAEVDRLMPAFIEAMAAGRVADPNKLGILFNTAVELVPGPDLAKAANALKLAEQMIAEGAAEGASAHATDIDEEVQPFAISRLKWRDTRTALHSEMERLKSSILSVCEGHENLSDVVSKVDLLFDYLAGLDTRLEDKLDEVVNTPTGPDREKRKAEARDLLLEYRATLQEPFFKAVDNGNGFTPVSIASTADSALNEIESSIAA